MNAPHRAEISPSNDDVVAFDTLVRAERVRLLAIARRAGLDPESALDCVQDACHTFLRLDAARGVLGRPDDAARLLRTVTMNAARNARRTMQRAAARSDGDTAPDEVAASTREQDASIAIDETRDSLERCMATLADRQRAVVTLRLLEELPGNEVASVLGITSEHVAVLLQRAKRALRGCMQAAGHGPDEEPCGCASDGDHGCRCVPA